MARRSSSRRGGGKGKTVVNKVFQPAFTLKGGYGKKRSGKSRS